MIRSSNSQAAQPRKQKSRPQATGYVRYRHRDTRAAVVVQEGNSEADWQLWEDSQIAFDGQFPSMKEQYTYVDAFASIYQER
jgi:hypothetical protein